MTETKEERKARLDKEIERAALGKQVMNNPMFQEALTARKAQIFDVFCKTKQEQGDIREEAWRTMKNLEALEKYFVQLLESGKMAEQKMEAIDK